MVASSIANTYPSSSYTFRTKEPKMEKDTSVADRLARLKLNYTKEGKRVSVTIWDFPTLGRTPRYLYHGLQELVPLELCNDLGFAYTQAPGFTYTQLYLKFVSQSYSRTFSPQLLRILSDEIAGHASTILMFLHSISLSRMP